MMSLAPASLSSVSVQAGDLPPAIWLKQNGTFTFLLNSPHGVEALQAVNQNGVRAGFGKGNHAPLDVRRVRTVRARNDEQIAARGQYLLELGEILIHVHYLFAFEMSAATRAVLIFQHDA